jgi:subtilase family serine protease
MSWGFAEGRAVFARDEAIYDSYFDVPGVTFVASTGDYGAADPEYPAFSPNVVAVGGTSLMLNADNSYDSETGWGYYSGSAGAFIGSGGGISLYEPEPAYQQGVQSTGYRTTPDVSLVADPATGAWIADTYSLDPSDPFEIVGGTSVSAPAWAGTFALVNQGSAAAGGSALNSSSPTETQQALYSLPQNDYNVITNGSNGYTAGGGLPSGDGARHAGGEPAGIRPGRVPNSHVRCLGADGGRIAECRTGQHGGKLEQCHRCVQCV